MSTNPLRDPAERARLRHVLREMDRDMSCTRRAWVEAVEALPRALDAIEALEREVNLARDDQRQDAARLRDLLAERERAIGLLTAERYDLRREVERLRAAPPIPMAPPRKPHIPPSMLEMDDDEEADRE